MEALGLVGSGVPSPRSGTNLRAEEVKELRSIMSRLDDAQLRFEALKREVHQSDLFRNKIDVEQELKLVEDYINKVALSNWQKCGKSVWENEPADVLQNLGLQEFHRFFEWNISKRLDHLTELLQAELFGGRR